MEQNVRVTRGSVKLLWILTGVRLIRLATYCMMKGL